MPKRSSFPKSSLKKVAGAWGWRPHHIHVPNFMESGSLNFLDTSGPNWACYGNLLPLPYHFSLPWLSRSSLLAVKP